MSVARSWDRIFAWYDTNTPPGTLIGNPGAGERQLGELESLIDARLPDDFRASYRLLDGTRRGWLLHHGSLLPLAGIAGEWRWYRDQSEQGYGQGPDYRPRQLESPEIKPLWWTQLRVPLTENGGGDHEMLDLDPAPGGARGQIIHMSHEVGPTRLLVRHRQRRRRADQLSLWDDDDGTDLVTSVGTGVAGWLAQIADELESGVHAYSESSLMVCPLAWGRS